MNGFASGFNRMKRQQILTSWISIHCILLPKLSFQLFFLLLIPFHIFVVIVVTDDRGGGRPKSGVYLDFRVTPQPSL